VTACHLVAHGLLEEALLKGQRFQNREVDYFCTYPYICLLIKLSLSSYKRCLQPSFTLSSTTITNQNHHQSSRIPPEGNTERNSLMQFSKFLSPTIVAISLITPTITITNTCDHAMSVTFTPNAKAHTSITKIIPAHGSVAIDTGKQSGNLHAGVNTRG
jgi:hypothetical protein